MIATIVIGCVLLFVLWLSIENQDGEFAGGVLLLACLLSVSLIFGYTDYGNREEIIYKLQYEYSDETITDAENYNFRVKFGNNYWCRFSLRNEDLIDIDYYKNEAALKTKILNVLYNTKIDDNRYLKFQTISNISVDEETYSELIITFSDLNMFSKSEINLHISKENNLIYLTEDNIDSDINEVEDEVYRFIKEQIEAENLYWQTSLNSEKYKIK